MIRKNKSIVEIDKSAEIYYKEIAKNKPLSRKEELELWEKYKKHGDITARNKLVTSNLKFVVSIAKNYQGLGLSFADLVSEGNVGLIKAMDKFDGTKGYKIISYSLWWIKQSIIEALNKRNSLEAEDLPIDTTEDDVSTEDVESTVKQTMSDLFYDDEDSTTNKEIIKELFLNLTEKEQSILSDYFGLCGDKPMTMSAIGCSLGISKERVRQIIENAYRKLRLNAIKKNNFHTI